jgi:hypothetical protein
VSTRFQNTGSSPTDSFVPTAGLDVGHYLPLTRLASLTYLLRGKHLVEGLDMTFGERPPSEMRLVHVHCGMSSRVDWCIDGGARGPWVDGSVNVDNAAG